MSPPDKKDIRIGALVGMGPHSTAPFYDSLIAYARKKYGAKFDMDFPEIILFSLPTPFYPDKEIDHDLMRLQLKKGIECLRKAEADFIVIPCNVVHQYYPFMQSLTSIPILNLIDLVTESLDADAGAQVALIATEPTVKLNLYQDKLIAKNLNVFHTDDLQNKVNTLLTELKAAKLSARAHRLWAELIAYLEDNHCTCAVIACTDMTCCIPLVKTAIQFVDSSDLLASATIEEYIRRKYYFEPESSL